MPKTLSIEKLLKENKLKASAQAKKELSNFLKKLTLTIAKKAAKKASFEGRQIIQKKDLDTIKKEFIQQLIFYLQ